MHLAYVAHCEVPGTLKHWQSRVEVKKYNLRSTSYVPTSSTSYSPTCYMRIYQLALSSYSTLPIAPHSRRIRLVQVLFSPAPPATWTHFLSSSRIHV